MAKSSGTPEADWDEEKVLSALDHLQNMHIQVIAPSFLHLKQDSDSVFIAP